MMSASTSAKSPRNRRFTDRLALTPRTPYGFFTASNSHTASQFLTLRIKMVLIAESKFEEEDDESSREG
jgi:hypothetical protein